MLEQLFRLKENRTNVRTEILAGITTALTCYYIIIVNALILSESGAPFSGVYVATIVAAALSCFIMGFVANYPIAVASGMGLNGFVPMPEIIVIANQRPLANNRFSTPTKVFQKY